MWWFIFYINEMIELVYNPVTIIFHEAKFISNIISVNSAILSSFSLFQLILVGLQTKKCEISQKYETSVWKQLHYSCSLNIPKIIFFFIFNHLNLGAATLITVGYVPWRESLTFHGPILMLKIVLDNLVWIVYRVKTVLVFHE